MPSPVPPGYTRGPIQFVGAPAGAPQDDALYQWFWDEAGGFGARILLVIAGEMQPPAYAPLHARLAEWESDPLLTLHVPHRRDARNPAHAIQVQRATAIALLTADAGTCAAILGGTPLAQAIRRANAHGKPVAGFGQAAPFLCQHMLLAPSAAPQTLRDVVTFAPGLGLLNRIVVDLVAHTEADQPSSGSAATAHAGELPLRLVAAVASNPFLIPIALSPGSAAVLYPDTTLQALGTPGVTLIQGTGITAIDLAGPPHATSVTGAELLQLHQGDGFNLDEQRLLRGRAIDLPPEAPPRTTL